MTTPHPTPHTPTDAMDPGEFQALRESLGLGRLWIAGHFGVAEKSVQNWEKGRFRISAGISAGLRAIADEADRYVALLVEQLQAQDEPTLTVYREDAGYRAADPASPYTAGWQRAVAIRVKRELPRLRIVSHGGGEAPAPGLGPYLLTQLCDVLQGVFIDAPALADPRAFLVGEIEDLLDDVTGEVAYPELLAEARTWSDEQAAAILADVQKYPTIEDIVRRGEQA